METITIIRGDDEQFATTFTDELGAVIDLSDCEIFFTVKNQDDVENDDAEALIQKNLDSTTFTWDDDPVNWLVNIVLTNTDTDIAPWSYYWDIQLKSDLWFISSVQRGSFIVLADTTRRTTLPVTP